MEKRALGKGLSALIPETRNEDAAGDILQVPTKQIVPNPFQPRTLFDPLKMEELVSSIREHGILQPVLLRPVGHERYQLVAGERRFRAAQAAGLTTIPALVKNVTEREQLEIAVVENLQREDIGPLETARAYSRLLDEFGLTQEAVAERVGKSRSSVANLLRLLNLPEVVQDSLERNEITEGHARHLLIAEDEQLIIQAWQAVVKRNLNVRETDKLAKEMRARAQSALRGSKSPASPEPEATAAARHGFAGDWRLSDPNLSELVDRLQQMLGTRVALRQSASGAGKLEIDFYNAQDLDRLFDMLLPGG